MEDQQWEEILRKHWKSSKGLTKYQICRLRRNSHSLSAISTTSNWNWKSKIGFLFSKKRGHVPNCNPQAHFPSSMKRVGTIGISKTALNHQYSSFQADIGRWHTSFVNVVDDTWTTSKSGSLFVVRLCLLVPPICCFISTMERVFKADNSSDGGSHRN